MDPLHDAHARVEQTGVEVGRSVDHLPRSWPAENAGPAPPSTTRELAGTAARAVQLTEGVEAERVPPFRPVEGDTGDVAVVFEDNQAHEALYPPPSLPGRATPGRFLAPALSGRPASIRVSSSIRASPSTRANLASSPSRSTTQWVSAWAATCGRCVTHSTCRRLRAPPASPPPRSRSALRHRRRSHRRRPRRSPGTPPPAGGRAPVG
jgi:hypothetical protein